MEAFLGDGTPSAVWYLLEYDNLVPSRLVGEVGQLKYSQWHQQLAIQQNDVEE